jgi:LmbE family N-acetylglucosaminyl deacetylase
MVHPAQASPRPQRSRPTVLVVSPHLDDVALSIGGWFERRIREDPANAFAGWHIVNVFPRSVYSPHRLNASTLLAVTAARRAEDARFTLRYGIAAIDLDLDDSSVAGISDELESLIPLDDDPRSAAADAALAALISALRPEIIILPAGIGHHIDHRIVMRAVARCVPHGTLCIMCEDMPYGVTLSEREVAEAVRAAHGPTVDAWCVDISATIGGKAEALRSYESQLDASTIDSVIQYAGRQRPGRFLERLWVAPADEDDLGTLRDLGLSPFV